MPSNRFKAVVLLLLFCTFILIQASNHGQASSDSSETFFNPQIQAMLDQVDPGTIYTLTGDLSGEWPVPINDQTYTISTRYALSGEPIEKAAQYLYQHYQDLGLNTSFQNFTYRGQMLSNVVAEKPGTVFPERVYLITSHYDDVPSTPGADDNASGTVGVMVAASILDQFEFGCTLRFANFSAEEFGMIGSADYARQSYCAGEDLRAVINLDMIAWNTSASSPEMDLHALSSIPGSMEIADVFQDVVSTYSLNLTPTLAVPVTSSSDHSSFWRKGYPAILVSEDSDDFNPYYHSADDRLDNLQDFNYYTEMIKASLATLAHMGCLVENGWGTVTGRVTDNDTKEPITGAAISLYNPQWDYTFSTRSDSNGDYQISALDGWHDIYADGIGYALVTYSGLYVTGDQALNFDLGLEAISETATFIPLIGNGNQNSPPGCP